MLLLYKLISKKTIQSYKIYLNIQYLTALELKYWGRVNMSV